MRCQQRAKRRCPRRSSDVPEADRAPPAGARSAPGEPAENLNRGRSKCVLSGAVHPPRPPRIGRGVLLCAHAQTGQFMAVRVRAF